MDSKAENRVDALRKEIDEAFGSLPYPGDDQIIQKGTQDYEETMALLSGKHWKDISPSDLVFNGEYIAYTKPLGFQFFLPAWLLAMIQDDVDTDVLPDDMVWSFTVPKSGEPGGFLNSTASKLDHRQWQVVRHVLEFMRDSDFDVAPVCVRRVEIALRSLEDAGYI